LPSLLGELQNRARLHSEFNQALSQSVPEASTIDQQAALGNPLACFYQQWLTADQDLNPPPHAWAAQACKLYQTQASDWQQLNETFPEHRLVNRFLRLQLNPDPKETDALRNRLGSGQQTPLQQFMAQALQAGTQPNRDSLALAVLSSAAVDAPQFMLGSIGEMA
jgi:hypothetical protein